MKSRTASKDRKFAAKAPTEEGRLSKRICSTRPITRADTLISTSLLSLSTTRARTTGIGSPACTQTMYSYLLVDRTPPHGMLLLAIPHRSSLHPHLIDNPVVDLEME